MEKTGMASHLYPLSFTRSSPWFAALLLLSFIAFWPTYFALGLGGSDGFVHLHAFATTLWMLMLIAQPLAIQRRRMDVHRLIGKGSYAVAPLVIVSVILLANQRINAAMGDMIPVQRYVLYLQMSLGFLFALSYILAIRFRARPSFHARFMICTALTLIDPILARVILWMNPGAGAMTQLISFGVTDLVLVSLIVWERNSANGREVFPLMLAAFILVQLPALLGFTESGVWQVFTNWFAALPLT
jgi:hypothetical protein